jgi:hypothetical protein
MRLDGGKNMEIKFEDIKYANESIITTDIKGKDYAEVNQRVKAFRMVYPTGFIKTDLIGNQDGVCIFEAKVGYYNDAVYENKQFKEEIVLATGTAYEKENSTFINKTSYIENCETSAVGRALGMAGFGIDTSIASAEEVQNAIENQNKKIEKEQITKIRKLIPEDNMDAMLKYYKIEKLEDMLFNDAVALIERKENANGKNSKH